MYKKLQKRQTSISLSLPSLDPGWQWLRLKSRVFAMLSIFVYVVPEDNGKYVLIDSWGANIYL